MIRSAGETNVGRVRQKNEDSLIVDPARGLYVVLDGMGGAFGGDIASQMARDVVTGASSLSMSLTGMAKRRSSNAAMSPVGPAPAIRTVF